MQQLIFLVALVLFLVKILAYILTHSVAVLTDTLESVVNVIAGIIGLYSLYVASKPRDQDHPYGHGKAEFLSAAVQGVLIIIAGIIVIYEAIQGLIEPHQLAEIDQPSLDIIMTVLTRLRSAEGFGTDFI